VPESHESAGAAAFPPPESFYSSVFPDERVEKGARARARAYRARRRIDPIAAGKMSRLFAILVSRSRAARFPLECKK